MISPASFCRRCCCQHRGVISSQPVSCTPEHRGSDPARPPERTGTSGFWQTPAVRGGAGAGEKQQVWASTGIPLHSKPVNSCNLIMNYFQQLPARPPPLCAKSAVQLRLLCSNRTSRCTSSLPWLPHPQPIGGSADDSSARNARLLLAVDARCAAGGCLLVLQQGRGCPSFNVLLGRPGMLGWGGQAERGRMTYGHAVTVRCLVSRQRPQTQSNALRFCVCWPRATHALQLLPEGVAPSDERQAAGHAL